MPVYLSVPLPGPFRYSKRLTRHHRRCFHRSRFHSPLYWLAGIWYLELCFWVVAGVLFLYGLMFVYAARGVRRLARSERARSLAASARARLWHR